MSGVRAILALSVCFTSRRGRGSAGPVLMDKRLTRRGAYAVAAALVAGGVGAAFAVVGAGG